MEGGGGGGCLPLQPLSAGDHSRHGAGSHGTPAPCIVTQHKSSRSGPIPRSLMGLAHQLEPPPIPLRGWLGSGGIGGGRGCRCGGWMPDYPQRSQRLANGAAVAAMVNHPSTKAGGGNQCRPSPSQPRREPAANHHGRYRCRRCVCLRGGVMHGAPPKRPSRTGQDCGHQPTSGDNPSVRQNCAN